MYCIIFILKKNIYENKLHKYGGKDVEKVLRENYV